MTPVHNCPNHAFFLISNRGRLLWLHRVTVWENDPQLLPHSHFPDNYIYIYICVCWRLIEGLCVWSVCRWTAMNEVFLDAAAHFCSGILWSSSLTLFLLFCGGTVDEGSLSKRSRSHYEAGWPAAQLAKVSSWVSLTVSTTAARHRLHKEACWNSLQ